MAVVPASRPQPSQHPAPQLPSLPPPRLPPRAPPLPACPAQIFKWSIIRTATDYSASALLLLRNLRFEDFLEALVRIACVIALPTDSEVHQSGCADAGEFLLALQASEDPYELAHFVDSRRLGWMHEPRTLPWRCVAHLLALIVRTYEENTSRGRHGRRDQRISEGEAVDFEQRRRAGMSLEQMRSAAGLLDGIRAAASIIRTRLLWSLNQVELFEGIGEEGRERLCDAMADAPYARGQFVFEQREEGHTFYVIIEGVASVIHTEIDAKGRHTQTVLARLGDGDFFGERALLKDELRYASVRVESVSLWAMAITRDDLEHVIGEPLEHVLPDRYRLDRAELLSRLRSIRLFAPLSEGEVALLVERFAECRYFEGESVFREGDLGDSFYVVLSGRAAALRFDAERGEDVEIAPITVWSCFGERALVRREARVATIRVTSPELRCLVMTQTHFEALLGRPLADLSVDRSYDDIIKHEGSRRRLLRGPSSRQHSSGSSSATWAGRDQGGRAAGTSATNPLAGPKSWCD